LKQTKNFCLEHSLFNTKSLTSNLVHLTDQTVDELFTVTKVTTLNEVLELASPKSTGGRRELEWPQEVGGLLEVGADSENLVDEILNGDDTILTEGLLNELVVGLRRVSGGFTVL
jgi:hypothetical protein